MNKCPCSGCGFFTTGEEWFGSYNICPVCGWEDDNVQLANPACEGGANGESLIDYQQQIIKDHPVGEMEYQGYKRDPRWRPLNEQEIEKANMQKERKYWMNKGINRYEQAYWVNFNTDQQTIEGTF